MAGENSVGSAGDLRDSESQPEIIAKANQYKDKVSEELKVLIGNIVKDIAPPVERNKAEMKGDSKYVNSTEVTVENSSVGGVVVVTASAVANLTINGPETNGVQSSIPNEKREKGKSSRFKSCAARPPAHMVLNPYGRGDEARVASLPYPRKAPQPEKHCPARTALRRLRKELKRRGIVSWDFMKTLDTNRNEVISQTELHQGLEKLGISLEPLEAQAIFAVFDTDLSGEISFEELHSSLIHIPKELPESERFRHSVSKYLLGSDAGAQVRAQVLAASQQVADEAGEGPQAWWSGCSEEERLQASLGREPIGALAPGCGALVQAIRDRSMELWATALDTFFGHPLTVQ